MPTIPLHHSELPDFAAGWPEAVAAIITRTLERELAPADVRTIVLRPASGFLSLGVWLGVKWSDHPYVGGAAAGSVPLTQWLDGLDAIARGEKTVAPRSGFAPERRVTFLDAGKDASFRAWWRALHDGLVATAISLATGALAERFEQPVGVFIAAEAAEATARLVAFCHPHGAPLWPLVERQGGGRAYPHASLQGDTCTLFYPEGEGGSGGEASFRAWTLADLREVRGGRDDRDFLLRFNGETSEVQIRPGICHEEMGGPSQAEVGVALAAFFTASGRYLPRGARPKLALPQSAADLAAAIEDSGGDVVRVLRSLAASYGVPVLVPLVEGLTLAPLRFRAIDALVDEALTQDAWGEALVLLAQLPEANRTAWIGVRARLGLERWEEVLALAPADSPERALALCRLGRAGEALPLASRKRDGNHLAVKALVEAQLAPVKSVRTAAEALAKRPQPHFARHLEREPLFAAQVHAQREFAAAQEASGRQLGVLPVEELDGVGTALSAGPVTQVFAAAERQEKKADETGEQRPLLNAALRRGDGFWAGDGAGRLFELRPDGEPKLLHAFDSPITALEATLFGVVVACGGHVSLVDEAGAVVASVQSFVDGDGPVASSGTLLACVHGSAVGLYRVELRRLTWLGAVAMPDGRSFDGVAFAGERLLVSGSGQLWSLDVSDPARPQATHRYRFDGKLKGSAEGTAVLVVDERVTFVEAGAPLRAARSVRVDGAVELAQFVGGNWLLVVGDRMLTVRQSGVSCCTVLGDDGHSIRSTSSVLAVWPGTSRVDAVTRNGLVSALPLPLDAGAVTAGVEAALPEVREWLRTTVEEALEAGVAPVERAGEPVGPAAPLGGVVVMWPGADGARLSRQVPCSVVSLAVGDSVALDLTPAALERDSAREMAARKVSVYQQRVAAELDRARVSIGDAARARAVRDLLREVGDDLAPRSQAKEFLLAMGQEFGVEILGVVPGGGSAGPKRAEEEAPAERSLREQLAAPTAYRSVDVWAARARRDESFRGEVLQLLAGEDLEAAARIAVRVIDVDVEASGRAWLAVAGRNPVFALRGVLSLNEHGHPGARAQLKSWVDHADASVALGARLALGRVDEDATVGIVERYLTALGSGSYDEPPMRTLMALSDERLARLRAALLHVRAETDDRVLVPLVRGGWQPDQEALSAGNRERLEEDDLVASLFEERTGTAATAIRLWVARRIAVHAAGTGPLWPVDIPLERSRVGWQRFFDQAWPEWARAGALERIHQRVARTARDVKADATLALQLLYQNLLRGEARVEFAEALSAVPYDAGAKEQLTEAARLSRVQFGWSLVKQKRFEEARRVATMALAEGPNDGQVLFFDARLAWLERDDPTEALRRIGPALARAADGIGRVRLLNLHGAALDALGKPDQALEWFRKALAAAEANVDVSTGKPQDPPMLASVLSNIAEAHWKLGNHAEARTFAEKARRRGSTTDIVKTILAETAE